MTVLKTRHNACDAVALRLRPFSATQKGLSGQFCILSGQKGTPRLGTVSSICYGNFNSENRGPNARDRAVQRGWLSHRLAHLRFLEADATIRAARNSAEINLSPTCGQALPICKCHRGSWLPTRFTGEENVPLSCIDDDPIVSILNAIHTFQSVRRVSDHLDAHPGTCNAARCDMEQPESGANLLDRLGNRNRLGRMAYLRVDISARRRLADHSYPKADHKQSSVDVGDDYLCGPHQECFLRG